MATRYNSLNLCGKELEWEPILWIQTVLGIAAAAAAKLLQSCPTLCDPIDGSPPGSTVLGILQARTLEWVATAFSNAWKWKVKGKSLSPVWLFVTTWTAAHQLLRPWEFPGKSTGVWCHCLLWFLALQTHFPLDFPSFSYIPRESKITKD